MTVLDIFRRMGMRFGGKVQEEQKQELTQTQTEIRTPPITGSPQEGSAVLERTNNLSVAQKPTETSVGERKG